MSTPIVKRTWAPVGKTPVYKRRARSHDKVTIIGAVVCRRDATQARFYFRMLPGRNANSSAFVAFLEQLLLNIPGPIIVIWDRLSAHRSKKVVAWLMKHPRVTTEFLPAYAPELNPVEQAWGYLKGHEMKNFAPHTLEELHARAKIGACRMRRRRPIVDSWLSHCGLRFDPMCS